MMKRWFNEDHSKQSCVFGVLKANKQALNISPSTDTLGREQIEIDGFGSSRV